MNRERADEIVEVMVGASSVRWDDSHREFWSNELLRFDDGQVAELVARRLVAKGPRPALKEFQDSYRDEMQTRLTPSRRRTETCDGSRFLVTDAGAEPCPTCNPSLAIRFADGEHHERLSPIQYEAEPPPPPACSPRAHSGALMPPSAAIVRLHGTEHGHALAAYAIDAPIVRQRVDAALAAKGSPPIDWRGMKVPSFMRPAFPTQRPQPAGVATKPIWDDDDF